MPLINILLGTMLLLIAVLAWMMLSAYQREELKARRECIRLIYAASRDSNANAARSRVVRPALATPTRLQFFTVGREVDKPVNEARPVEYIRLPQRSEMAGVAPKNMTAGEGCHICA